MGNFPYLIKNSLIAWPGMSEIGGCRPYLPTSRRSAAAFTPGPRGVFQMFCFFFSSWGMGVLEVAFDSFRLARG
jgi:hypothetical protein